MKGQGKAADGGHGGPWGKAWGMAWQGRERPTKAKAKRPPVSWPFGWGQEGMWSENL